MCLIAIAHRASTKWPLVIAANRDEDHQRPTVDAHWWADAPDVIGGRDVLHGGAWLAVTRQGRFAAVTNLRGAEPRQRSRGFLVRDFVLSNVEPSRYAEDLRPVVREYAGFHLIVGVVGGDVIHVTGEMQREIEPGVVAISNAPVGENWPKTDVAAGRMVTALGLRDREAIVEDLLLFLRESRGSATPDREIFIRGERYGTRSSTVIIASDDEIDFVEQSFGPGGAERGEPRAFRFRRERA